MIKKTLILLCLLLSVSAFAQFVSPQGRRGQGFGRGPTGGNCLVPGYRGSGEEDLPTPRKIDHQGFVYARALYHTQPWYSFMREVPWHHDYPDGDTMFPTSLGRLTLTDTDENSYQL